MLDNLISLLFQIRVHFSVRFFVFLFCLTSINQSAFSQNKSVIIVGCDVNVYYQKNLSPYEIFSNNNFPYCEYSLTLINDIDSVDLSFFPYQSYELIQKNEFKYFYTIETISDSLKLVLKINNETYEISSISSFLNGTFVQFSFQIFPNSNKKISEVIYNIGDRLCISKIGDSPIHTILNITNHYFYFVDEKNNTINVADIFERKISKDYRSNFQILPYDESNLDSAFSEVVDSLKYAVEKRDTSLLFSFFHPQIVSSFGGGITGKQGFIDHWNLAKSDTLMWYIMRNTLALGGVFDSSGIINENAACFHFPYYNSNRFQKYLYFLFNEQNIEPYNIAICAKENVPIYMNFNEKDTIVDYLSYEVLLIDFEVSSNQTNNLTEIGYFKQVYVSSIDRLVKGWVEVKDLFFMAETSIIFEKINNKWVISGIYSFD